MRAPDDKTYSMNGFETNLSDGGMRGGDCGCKVRCLRCQFVDSVSNGGKSSGRPAFNG